MALRAMKSGGRKANPSPRTHDEPRSSNAPRRRFRLHRRRRGFWPAACWPTGSRPIQRSRVLLLEAGGRDNWIWFHIPVGYLFAIGNPRSDWMFETEKEPGLNGRSLKYPRGKVIGGCSAINAMISMRGQAQDYDHWRQLGLPGWGWDDVRPVFKRLDNHFLGDTEHHGAGGEWRVEEPRVQWAVLNAVAKAATEMGIPETPDFNTGDNTGVGYFHVNQKRGLRWSSARAFLKPVLKPDQPAPGDRRAGREGGRRGRARRRRAVPPGRPARRGAHQRRGHPVGGRRRLAADPAALRHRPGGLARRAGHRRGARHARASAATCRTICSSARSSRSMASRR